MQLAAERSYKHGLEDKEQIAQKKCEDWDDIYES